MSNWNARVVWKLSPKIDLNVSLATDVPIDGIIDVPRPLVCDEIAVFPVESTVESLALGGIGLWRDWLPARHQGGGLTRAPRSWRYCLIFGHVFPTSPRYTIYRHQLRIVSWRLQNNRSPRPNAWGHLQGLASTYITDGISSVVLTNDANL